MDQTSSAMPADLAAEFAQIDLDSLPAHVLTPTPQASTAADQPDIPAAASDREQDRDTLPEPAPADSIPVADAMTAPAVQNPAPHVPGPDGNPLPVWALKAAAVMASLVAAAHSLRAAVARTLAERSRPATPVAPVEAAPATALPESMPAEQASTDRLPVYARMAGTAILAVAICVSLTQGHTEQTNLAGAALVAASDPDADRALLEQKLNAAAAAAQRHFKRTGTYDGYSPKGKILAVPASQDGNVLALVAHQGATCLRVAVKDGTDMVPAAAVDPADCSALEAQLAGYK